MRLPRPRFTVRRIMIVVAVLALIMGPGFEVARLIQVALRYRQCAIGSREMAEASRRTAASLESAWRTTSTDQAKARHGFQAAEQRWIKYGEYHSAWALQCDRVAWRPWLLIEDYAPPEYPFPDDWYLGPR